MHMGAIRYQIDVVLVVPEKIFCKVPPRLDLPPLQLHAPLQGCPIEAIMEIMDQELIVVDVGCYLMAISSKMSLRTTDPLYLSKSGTLNFQGITSPDTRDISTTSKAGV